MMLTPCWPSAGPTGGAGFAAPAWICSLMIAASFFLGGMTSLLLDGLFLDLRDLAEGQLDGCLATEDRHEDVQLLVHRVDLADRGRQGGERSVHDGDRLADLVVDDLDPRLLAAGRCLAALGDLDGLLRGRREDLDDLVQGQWGRSGGGADEAGHPRRVPDRAPRLVVEVHPDQDVAREDLALNRLALAVLDLVDLFGRHLDLEDVVLHVE